MKQTLLIALNEINFPMVSRYVGQGKLPNFGRLFDEFGYRETTSESQYEHLEPWIQWVTAHTGLPFAEHGIFRLGDIVHSDVAQIWETLEKKGKRVAAISPMNATNNTKEAAFFVPDPWTKTPVTGSFLLKKLHQAVTQAVSENASSGLSARSAAWIVMAALAYVHPSQYTNYLTLASKLGKKWTRAMTLDTLLSDVFISLTKRTKPDFASLFLNAGAHIQHHYLFSSSAYDGGLRNPDWHVDPDADPIADVYALYDRIVGRIRVSFPDYRIMLATGLHQDPHPTLDFYWRLKNHAEFLSRIGISFESVEPLMSRDFLIIFGHAHQAKAAEKILSSATDENGIPLFEVDNRGTSIFSMLTYPHEITENTKGILDGCEISNLRGHVSFVALKNGQHNGIGYLTDTGCETDASTTPIRLAEIPQLIERAVCDS